MLLNAKLYLKLDRQSGTFSIDETESTRIYSRDENVALTVDGWTLDEVTKTSGKTPYEPYFKLTDACGRTLALAKLEPQTTPTPTEEGTYVMSASLSTNTVQLVRYLRENGNAEMLVDGLVFSTTSANPIAKGGIMVHPFFGACGEEPQDLPSGASELASLKTDLDAHKNNHSNPHQVTPAQIGALTALEGDARYASVTALTNLSNAVQAAQTAILGLQSAVATANALIQGNTAAINTKASASDTYRKSETYSRGEIDQFVTSLRINPIMGKNFTFKTQNETRSALATVIQLLGGVVNGQWEVVHEQAAPMTRIPMAANGVPGTVYLKAVKVDGELTSEVVQ